MKKTDAPLLSAKDMEKAYEIFQGLFFEGSWLDNDELAEAFLAWAKTAWPEWAKGNDKLGDAAALETGIRDEEGEGELAAFVNSLPPGLKAEAAQGLHDDVESMDADGSGPLLKKLAALVKAGAAEVPKGPDVGKLVEEARDLYEDESFKKALKQVERALEGVEEIPTGKPRRIAAIAEGYLVRGWLRWNDDAGMVDLPKAVADLKSAIRWGRAAGNADDALVSLSQVLCLELRDYDGAIALVREALEAGLDNPEENRFYLFKTLGFAQLAKDDRASAEQSYKVLFDEYGREADSREVLIEELTDDYPEHRKDNVDEAKRLAQAFKSKRWPAAR